MAANEKEIAEVNAMAFEIFKDRVAAGNLKRSAEAEAAHAFQMAESFLKTRAAYAKGEIKPKAIEAARLSAASAPNLKRTHPHNLVSERFGNLDRVKKIKAWLDAHPTPEKDPDDLIHQLNREFADLSWDLPAVNTARALFPFYCVSN